MKMRIALLCGALLIAPFALHFGAFGAENGHVRVFAGTEGVAITSKATGVSAELVLVNGSGRPSGKLQASQVKLPSDGSFVEVSPAGQALELRMKIRFAVVPGFHLDDALFDPTALGKGAGVAVRATAVRATRPDLVQEADAAGAAGQNGFMRELRALLKKRAYDKAARLAGASKVEQAKAHASDALRLKKYIALALANAGDAEGHLIKVHGMRGKLIRVEDGQLLIRARGAEISWPIERLPAKEIVSLAELKPGSGGAATRALFYWAEGDIANARAEAGRAKGELAERVKKLAALGAPRTVRRSARTRSAARSPALAPTGGGVFVPAENFMMVVPEGGKSAFVITWPRGGSQVTMLIPSGSGRDARFAAARITFGGKPVFVGLLDHVLYVDDLDTRNISYDRTVKPRRYKYAEVRTGMKIPFDAYWWTAIAKPLGKGFTYPSFSGYGWVPPAKPVAQDPPGQPTWMWPGQKPGAGVPVWMWMVSNKPGRSWTDILNYVPYASTTVGGEWVLHLEQRWSPYYAAVTYPKARGADSKSTPTPKGKTPADKMTLSDILYETLGEKEVKEIIAAEGLKGRWVGIPKGEPSIPATCAGWGVVPRSLKARNKSDYMKRVQACYNFCFYNKARTDEMRGAAKEIAELCKQNSGKAGVRSFAARVAHSADQVEEFYREDNAKFRKTIQGFSQKFPELISPADAANANLDAAWFKRLKGYYERVYNDWAEKDNAKAVKMIYRSHWTSTGGTLDGLVWNERRLLKRVGQEATLAGSESAEARALALKVRALVRQGLLNPHMKEGGLSRDYYAISRGKRK